MRLFDYLLWQISCSSNFKNVDAILSLPVSVTDIPLGCAKSSDPQTFHV